MAMRPQAQIQTIGATQAGGLIHFKINQQILNWQGFEVGMGKAEGLRNLLVFFGQQTAGGVDQTATRFKQTRRTVITDCP